MKCYICETELIWGGDHSPGVDEELGDDDVIMSNLTCPKCDAFHEVTWNKGDKNDTV